LTGGHFSRSRLLALALGDCFVCNLVAVLVPEEINLAFFVTVVAEEALNNKKSCESSDNYT